MGTYLGHLVLYVRNLQNSLKFYRDLLGLEVVAEVFAGKAAALTSGRTHHELLLIEVGDAPGPMQGRRLGLYHIGWCIGDGDEELREMRQRCISSGVKIIGMSDHTITHSLYVLDPDGNENELYTDVGDYDWKSDTSWVENPVKPLHL
jgi:catechol 2,3-dioxygenase